MLTAEELATITIAYEPVWAIGTGRAATTEQAGRGTPVDPRLCRDDLEPGNRVSDRGFFMGEVSRLRISRSLLHRMGSTARSSAGLVSDPDSFATIARVAESSHLD